MKKSIFSVCFMALFALTLCSFTPDITTPAIEDGVDVNSASFSVSDDLLIVVTLRHPGWFSAGSDGCWGWSFCEETIIVDIPSAPSTMTNNGNGTVTIDYNFEGFNAKNQEYYQNHSTHEIPEESSLTADELAGLELPQGTVIEVGNYPVTLDGGRMLVTYNIR